MAGDGFFAALRFDWVQLSISLVAFLLVAPAMFYGEFRRKQTPRIKFSGLKNVRQATGSLKVRLRHLPFWLRLAAVGMLLVSFGHPYLERELPVPDKDAGKEERLSKKQEERKTIEVPTEGISIQLLLDRSSSMGEGVYQDGTRFNLMKFEDNLLTKMDVVKIVSKRFIKGTADTARSDAIFTGRGNDLIGLFTFARFPFIACPLTLRHELLLDYISQLDTVRRRQEDGTYIGYALERAILQVVDAKSRAKEEDAYNIKSSIIVLITDGEQTIWPEDAADRHKALLPSEAAALAVDNDIKVYAIAVAPRVLFDEYGTVRGTGDNFQVDEIKQAAELTGGKFYLAENGGSLMDIYQEIDRLEKSQLPVKKELEARVEKTQEVTRKETEKIELFPVFLWSGLLLLLAELLVSTVYLRRIP